MVSAAGVAVTVAVAGIGVMASGVRWRSLRGWQPFAFAATAGALLYLAWLLIGVVVGAYLHLPSDPR